MAKQVKTIADLVSDPRNARQHNPRNLGVIEDGLKEVGFARSIVIDDDNVILAGNATVEACGIAGIERVKVVEADGETIIAVRRTNLTPEQKIRLALIDNRAGELATWNGEQLADFQEMDPALFAGLFSDAELDKLIAETREQAAREAGSGEGDSGGETTEKGSLAERFGIPPFSVLDARQGYWQDRKRAWLAIGIQSDLGRGDVMPSGAGIATSGSSEWSGKRGGASPGGSPRPAMQRGTDGHTERGDGAGRPMANGKGAARTFGQDLMRGEHTVGGNRPDPGLTWVGGDRDNEELDDTSRKILAAGVSGTSIFDPVMCELAYRWFCPPGGKVLDPFAGGSVRGIVAARVGCDYFGVDLRGEQIAANEAQAAEICTETRPRWAVGDSRDIAVIAESYGAGPEFDFVFTCPPYADLEVYSDDPRDLSNMDYAAFLEAYRAIVSASCAMLKPNRFACVVVGDIRDRKGMYRNFVGDTVHAFLDAGMKLYNEAVLVTAIGSLPLRVGKQFGSFRKLGKTHQNVLVFYNGDQKRIPEELGEVEFTEAVPGTESGEPS